MSTDNQRYFSETSYCKSNLDYKLPDVLKRGDEVELKGVKYQVNEITPFGVKLKRIK